ncbi:MAG TPA: AraC family transcriptional regulator [Mycobacterium sp.]
MAYIRATALAGYPELVRELGGDPQALLRHAGIPDDLVARPDAFIGFRDMVLAIESAARSTRTDDFGRQLARRQNPNILGPLWAAASTAPTVGTALSAIIDHFTAYSPAIAISVQPTERPDRALVDYRVLLDDLPDHRQTIELALGVSLNFYRLLIGPHFAPLVVHLPHRAMGSRADYIRYFGARLQEEQPAAAFTIRASDLERPITADSTVHQTLITYLQSITPPASDGVVAQIQSMTEHLLGTSTLDISFVARQFSMHPRTLQRRLATAGTTFDKLVDRVRREAARRYLRDTDMSMTQLAGILGYAEQSVLTRACRRWFDASPLTARRQLRASTLGVDPPMDRADAG